MSSRSIFSFFKKPVNTVYNNADDVVIIPESSCTVVNSDVIVKMFPLLLIVVHYQKSLIIHRKIFCFRQLSLDLDILVLFLST